MSLSVIATPIGNIEDISLRALKLLKQADLIIGEERKIVGRLIRDLEIGYKVIELLNEHSDQKDLEYLLGECKTKAVALVSDCGTPGFCDPGAELVNLCRSHGIEITIVPGASSLMAFLSGSGLKLTEFYFKGFLPANSELRKKEFEKLKATKIPVILMDTPYRLEKTLNELSIYLPTKKIILATSLTQSDESFDIGSAKQLQEKYSHQKKEFILAIY